MQSFIVSKILHYAYCQGCILPSVGGGGGGGGTLVRIECSYRESNSSVRQVTFVPFKRWMVDGDFLLSYWVYRKNNSTVSIIQPDAKSSELFIEDQAFSPSYDLAPTPPPPPRQELDRRHTGKLRKRDNSLKAEGEGKELNHTTAGVLYKSFNTLWPHFNIPPPSPSFHQVMCTQCH